MNRVFVLLVALSCGTGCFGARPTLRSYYVLNGQPDRADVAGGGASEPHIKGGAPVEEPQREPLFRGLCRVRNLNAEDVYEKFQIVVRRSPYELRYSDLHVWAVKPDNMVSDVIARALTQAGIFTSVTRELGDQRPDYTLGGELHAIEIYDSNDLWFAHLAMTLSLNRFSTGERLWRMEFDMRKPVATASFSHAVRALSEILGTAMVEAEKELEEIAQKPRGAAVPDAPHEEGDVEKQPLVIPDLRVEPK